MLYAATREVAAFSRCLPFPRFHPPAPAGAGKEPMTSHAPAAQTFILRMWLERDDAESLPGEWRGELKHVPSGHAAYFRTLEGLPPVLQRLLDGTAQAEGTAREGGE